MNYLTFIIITPSREAYSRVKVFISPNYTWFIHSTIGYVTIKRGYSWDGCTFAIDTDATDIASCVHDAFYQFNFITRKRADLAFYDLLKQNKFPFAKIYYISVRLFGFIFY